MSGLKERICAQISAAGPINVAEYMAICLFDPAEGYYTTRDPFGAAGDFITAPEISQMFGELCAVWLYTAWKASGAPAQPLIAEIGPGRGTLMKDMLRTFVRLSPPFAQDARFAMIEASPRLTEVQRKTLAQSAFRPWWYGQIDELPDGPLFIVGNELFDAIPMRQYVKSRGRWHERVVGCGGDGELIFMAGPGTVDQDLLSPDASSAPDGAIIELAPARTALMDTISTRIAARGGAGLFIDYGYEKPAVGDSLQAMRAHTFADPLAEPGKADLTSHVDFHTLAQTARAAGLDAHLMEQGAFLLGLGLLERAGRLGAGAGPVEQEAIRAAVERLAGPQAMGRLFKVMALTRAGLVVPPFEKTVPSSC